MVHTVGHTDGRTWRLYDLIGPVGLIQRKYHIHATLTLSACADRSTDVKKGHIFVVFAIFETFWYVEPFWTFWTMLENIVPFWTFWTIQKQFEPFWTTLDHIRHHFGPFWTILDHFRPFWTTLDNFGLFMDPIWPYGTILVHFGPL